MNWKDKALWSETDTAISSGYKSWTFSVSPSTNSVGMSYVMAATSSTGANRVTEVEMLSCGGVSADSMVVVTYLSMQLHTAVMLYSV